MFTGQHSHTIDAKGRTTIPVCYRQVLEQGAYLTQGFGSYLALLTAPSFEGMFKTVNDMSLTDPTARSLKRLIFANAQMIEFDRLGRILIPDFLIKAAHITRPGEVVVAGVGDNLEIWASDLWASEYQRLQDAEANVDRFTAVNLPIH